MKKMEGSGVLELEDLERTIEEITTGHGTKKIRSFGVRVSFWLTIIFRILDGLPLAKESLVSCQEARIAEGRRLVYVCVCLCRCACVLVSPWRWRGFPEAPLRCFRRGNHSVSFAFLFSYKMMYAGRLVLVLAAVVSSAVALPNHLKAVVTDKEPVPQASQGVAASFGPFSAKAEIGEGGLSASADSPLGTAGAGIGNGGLGASASTGGGLGASAGTGGGLGGSTSTGGHPSQHKPGHYQPGLFDGIFNIPISVLQAVNQYLNNRGPITKPVHRRRGHEPPVYKTVTPEQSAGSEVGTSAADSNVGAGATAESSASSTTGHRPVMINKRVNYDDIFAIPISALKSVNQLLNGKK
ncbi:uncharacterized protein LOC128989135 [Macrosteles quadrilineatus]|uniref:uncharacterized protein LOC128989135 n=1 Tax=Macrosteles quadrilineatus TaxID=74068 RepID=UPI0023E117DB|nr:uncharacterized protein LOC128989135 [Macrosteles quadrilineatus]